MDWRSCSFSFDMSSFLRATYVSEPSRYFGGATRILEVSADGLLHLFTGVEQPQHDEERHHGGDEVGVSDLPCAAVVAAMALLLLDNDDGGRQVRHSDNPSLVRVLCSRRCR